MKWHKLGQVFTPNNHYPWLAGYAANPVAVHQQDSLFRIYFSCRDKANRSHIGFVDVDLEPSPRVLAISDTPILTPGELGAFDDSGTSLACITLIKGQIFLYYIGWNLGVTVPWRNSIGLAIYNPEVGFFERYSPAPIMDRHRVDPYSLSYPFVLEDERLYRMWYGSNLSWGAEVEDMTHLIKYAESTDGVTWYREGHIAIPFKTEDEYAISRPFVLKEAGRYKMWYSYRRRKQTYRIGYAESIDGMQWERMDKQAGLDVSKTGWDADMICYPFIFDYGEKRYLLYNGNGYGKTGFGLAVLI